MEPLPYALTLDGPATIRVVEYDAMQKRAYVSSVALRSEMRRALKQLSHEHKLPDGLELELFGELRPDGFSRASMFRISGALSEQALSGSADDTVNLPAGTTFTGFVAADVPTNSPQSMAVLMSLLGVRRLRTSNVRGGIPCTVSVNTGDVNVEELDPCNPSIAGDTLHEAILTWLPIIRRAVISYFAARPNEMFSMPSRDFEMLTAELLRSEGFDVRLTPETRDGGYDVFAVRHESIAGDQSFLVECKRYDRSKKIGIGVVRSLIGVVQLGNVTKGMLVTTSQLSGPAKALVTSNSSRLVSHDYGTLVQWLKAAASAQITGKSAYSGSQEGAGQ